MAVLFVDDEKQILRGIDRMLDAAEVDWDVELANSGVEALAALTNNDEITTVITDMKMPGMDGAQLLHEISIHFPHVVRIVLSGQSSKESVFRAIPSMHQYLAKPCNAETLKTTINRANALQEVLNSDKLVRLVGGINTLPSLPRVYQEIVKAVENESCSVDEIGEIISQDVAMTAKILQIANSAMFGLRNPVTSASRATAFLGLETIKSLVLSVGVFQEFECAHLHGCLLEELMRHSLEVGTLSKKIAMAENLKKDEIDSAFTAGVLHDLGKLILLTVDAAQFGESVKKARLDNLPSWQAEECLFGVSHVSAGAYMLRIWGIPQSIIEVVALHHSPLRSGENRFSILTAVAAANEISQAVAGGSPGRHERFEEYLTAIGCDKKLDSWKDLCVSQECE